MTVFVDAVLWGSTLVFSSGVGHWWYCVGQSIRTEGGEKNVSAEETQARILTVGDSPKTVQKTVNECPCKDIRVISEQEMDIEGAKVHVVPGDFECDATYKGRALEWARTHVDRTSEYTLFLDEDTLVGETFDFQEGDVLQMEEKPYETTSKLAYLVDRMRIGTTKEMDGFEMLKYPLYTWGGCLAIRDEVEDEVTWDEETVCEDTSFSIRAAKKGYGFATVDKVARNQSPTSMMALFKQRKRWAGGSYQAVKHVGRWWTALIHARMAGWIASITSPILTIWSLLVEIDTSLLYDVVSVAMLLTILAWLIVSALRYRDDKLTSIVVFLLSPLLLALNGVGALWGTVDRPDGFEVTKKA